MDLVLIREKRIRRVKQLTTAIPGAVLVLRFSIEQLHEDAMKFYLIEMGQNLIKSSNFKVIFSKRYLDPEGVEVFYVLEDTATRVSKEIQAFKEIPDLGGVLIFDIYEGTREVLKGFTLNA